MITKRHIEVFSAGCPVCEETIRIIDELVCPSCDVEVLDINDPDVAERAVAFSIRSIPAVVIDGQLANCCAGRGISIPALRDAGIGVPL